MIALETQTNNTTPAATQLAACLLLAGSLKPSPLVAETGGSVLDLFLSPTTTVFGAWLERFGELAEPIGAPPVVRVIFRTNTPPPNDAEARRRAMNVKIEEDHQQYRGPGGAVKDACASYQPDSVVLVAEAARYVSGSLIPMFKAHATRESDITVGCNEDSSPAGVFLIRCRTLDLISKIGFTDLKEQWLGKAVAAGHSVRVHRLQHRSYELRTREGFLEAARVAGGLTSATFDQVGGVDHHGTANSPHPLGEGVSIGPGAAIVESVIMPGAQIGANAVVARSIVCPLGRVQDGATLVDAVIPPSTLPAFSRTPKGAKP